MASEYTKDQISEISNLLLEYSAGNYSFQGKISNEVNELDMIISGINMLGEELDETNVSRDYFSSIFNAVTDLVLIIDDQGNITDANRAAELALVSNHQLIGTPLDQLMNKANFFDDLAIQIESKDSVTSEEELIGKDGDVIYGLLTCSKIIDRFQAFKGYLISIKDITEQKENEKLILKTIFSTQQREQKRVADDLHDSIGQELSMTKLMISNLKLLCKDDPKQLELIDTSSEILDNSIRELREICFNLMPNVLSKGGLALAVNDLLSKLDLSKEMEVSFRNNEQIPRLDPELEVVIYRIIQEFINNMIKHANASLFEIEINIEQHPDLITITMKDNGQGFNMDKLKKAGENRGYENLKSRVKAFNGKLEMSSAPGKGTRTEVTFPFNPQL